MIENKDVLKIGIMSFCVIALSILFYFILKNAGGIYVTIKMVCKILTPIIYGAIMAFLIDPVYNKCYIGIMRKLKNKKVKIETADKIAKTVSIFVSLFIVILIIFTIVMLIVPQLVIGMKDLIESLPYNINRLNDMLYDYAEQNKFVSDFINENLISFNQDTNLWLKKNILPNINNYWSSFSSGIYGILKHLISFIIGIIVMMYLLSIKFTLKAHTKKICYSILPIRFANMFIEEARFVKVIFSKFIVGKIIDSIIIGVINYIFMLIIGMPYALVISAIIGFTNVIPFFGPFLGAIPSIIILLTVSPISAVQFAVWILVLQQVDGNIIGPKILGQTTGINSFWILFSIILFGGLFGIVGMIIGVPTFAVIYRLVSRFAKNLLMKRGLSDETKSYLYLKIIDTGTKEYIENNRDIL